MLLPLLLALTPQAFFHLHQAVGHLERAVTTPTCATHRPAAQAHLAEVPAELPPDWARLRDAVVTALDAPDPSADTLERLRIELHALAVRAKLPHEDAWRAAFERCPE